jgi:glycosyltransferase involved in cell wall biosynthesis
MKVLLTATSLERNYGGPAFSISRLATALVDSGVEVGLWAADGSAPGTQLLPKQTLVQRFTGSESEALNRFGGADIFHDNGIWLPHNHRIAVLAERGGIPRVVSLRGMLEPWAFRHKHAKKKVAWWLYQRRDLIRAQCHITTSQAEAENLRRHALGVPIATIPNGVDLPEDRPLKIDMKSSIGNRQKTAVFLGRIYPVKGLPMLVEAWARVRPVGWRLLIAGPDEAGHQKQVEEALSAAGLGDEVSFVGPVEGKTKSDLLFNADLFVSPTYSENFGMAIAEALAHRVPVLTTTGAPWPMLQKSGSGWWVEPTLDGISEGLRQATNRDLKSLQQMGNNGRDLVSRQFGWSRVAHLMRSTYEEVLRRPSHEDEEGKPTTRLTRGEV